VDIYLVVVACTVSCLMHSFWRSFGLASVVAALASAVVYTVVYIQIHHLWQGSPAGISASFTIWFFVSWCIAMIIGRLFIAQRNQSALPEVPVDRSD